MDIESEAIIPEFFKPMQSVQDWKEIEERLSVVHPIRFDIDGYNIRMHMVDYKMKLVIVLFIGGQYDVGYFEKEKPEIIEKFYQKKEKYYFDKKFRDHYVKRFGMRKAKKNNVFKKYPYMQYYWTSFRSLRLHLQKSCKEIMVYKLDLAKTFGELFMEYKSV